MKKSIKDTCLTLLYVTVFIITASCSEDRYRSDKVTQNAIDSPYGISIDEARDMLLEIMDGMETTKSSVSLHRNISESYSVYRHSSGETKSGDEEPYIHIFNFDDESGFAIMSADRRVTPLLAYALSGNLEEGVEADNPGLNIYISMLEDYFDTAIKQRSSSLIVNTIDWNHSGSPEFTVMVNGPCPVKWNQGYPYNYYCPKINGISTYTGCTATAVAQLMCCYRYPDSYNGYDFDWEKMIESSNKEDTVTYIGGDDEHSFTGQFNPDVLLDEPDEYMLQVARLMQQVGLPENINIGYGTDGSSGGIGKTIRTFENFGYSSGGTEIINGLYESKTNRDSVIQELSNGYYCIIRAESKYLGEETLLPEPVDPNLHHPIGDNDLWMFATNAHCWLLDGLLKLSIYCDGAVSDIEYYYHCNFGWGGHADGFYLSGVFDTGDGPEFSDQTKSDYAEPHYPYPDIESDPDNYSYYIGYVIGIRK